MLQFISYLDLQHLTCSTIRVYLAAVRSFHIEEGHPPPPTDSPRVRKALRALDIVGVGPQQKLPITWDILCSLERVVPHHNVGGCTWPAMLLAFFGCLRAAELTIVKGTFSPNVHLRFCDASLTKDPVTGRPILSVLLRRSKTDTNNCGCTVIAGCSGSAICAPCVFDDYLKYRRAQGNADPISPLLLHYGAPLTKALFVKDTRLYLATLGYDCTKYSGHSFRAGSATSAAAAGLQDWELKLLGRWSSSTYQRYIRAPDLVLASFANRIGKGGRSASTGPPPYCRTSYLSNIFH